MKKLNGFIPDKIKVHLAGKKIIVHSCLVLILFSGCARYQYMSVNSKLDQDANKEFVIDNDTVNIKYKFSGENLSVNVTIFNKLHQPMYIDLGRSTVILNNQQINDAFYLEDPVNFIAPLAYISFSSNQLKNEFIDVKQLEPQKSVVYTDGSTTGRNFSFNEETTPLFFRVSLALTPNDDYSYPAFYDYSFWVSGIKQTIDGPGSRPYKPSNQFYIRTKPIFGQIVELTALLLVSAIIVGLAGGE